MENPIETESEEQEQEQSNSQDSSTSSQDRHKWITEQDNLREKLITADSFTWKLPTISQIGAEDLRFVGGVDISFSKDDPSIACGTLVVLDFRTLQVVFQDFSFVTLSVPYVAGFLAFREVLLFSILLAPVLLDILEKMKRSDNPFYPQLHHVDGLHHSRVRKLLEAKENSSKDFIPLVGCSGQTWGVAMRSTQGSIKPIYISTGHRISLQTATAIVQMTCKYRIPEPIRQADIRSRDYIRKFEMNARLKQID
ncbi:hypothetical protein KIW84_060859 [Lathyrus oleraceus]|uniref:Endonuclease V n=1 Tax=Pisum sativum TaxID=3888 RepID=A0A9D4W2K3_PEA|nr:hypothetical protein KIW84_060859 [Pisum sativum]